MAGTRQGTMDSNPPDFSRCGAAVDGTWAAYQPDGERPWNLRGATHLYRRAAFGATWAQLQQALAGGPQAAVTGLVRPPDETVEFQRAFDEYDVAAGSFSSDDGPRAWWLRRMIETPHPLLEKMTLFWHSHLGISRARITTGPLMVRLIHTLRSQALGNYGEMLAAMLHEPAVFLGLDADTNRKSIPNDHLARQLLTQYGPGPEAVDEQDVSEVARALTGWFVLHDELRFVEREHDTGVKRILGQSGPWAMEDVLRIVLQHPATARNIVRRVYRWLISETGEPEAHVLEPLAASFRRDYDIRGLVETMLRSNWFFSPQAYRRRVKCPVELALSMIRPLEASVPTLRLGETLARLGQDLLRPPTVAGWLGGRYWLNPAAMRERVQLALALLTPGGAHGAGLDPLAFVQRHSAADPAAAAKLLIDLLLGGDVSIEVRARLVQRAAESSAGDLPNRLRELVQDLAALPEFQLA
jgi:uncharacterized protein (DUF1800 family)